MIRYGRRGNELRVSLHYMPNCTRVIVPPMAGLDGAGGWRELYLAFTPIDDETHMWFITNHVHVTGAEKDAYLEQRERYLRRQREAGSALDLAQDVMEGRRALRRYRPSRPRQGAGFRGAGRPRAGLPTAATSASAAPTPPLSFAPI